MNEENESHENGAGMIKCFEKLKFLHENRTYYHRALWEKEKHYTWFLSLVLASAMVLVSQNDKLEPIVFWVVLFALTSLGVILAKIALAVVTAESHYFQIAFHRYMEMENALFPEDAEPLPDRKPVDLRPWKLLCKFFSPRERMGIRDIFRFTFVLFQYVFALVALVALIGFIYYAYQALSC